MQYTDLFLDFDDTLYDTHGNACLALAEVFDHFNLGRYFKNLDDFTVPYWETNEELWSQYSRGEIERPYLIVERFRRPLALGDGLTPTVEQCLEISDFFLDRCCEQTGIISGAHELLQYLKDKGYRLHMTSNGFHEVQYKKLNAVDMAKYFDTIVLSEDARVNKPAKEFFDYAFNITHAPREKTLLIGDNLMTDIYGAYNAGLPQIWFNPQSKPLTTFPVTHIVTSLSQIPQIL